MVVIFCNIYPGKLIILPKTILLDFQPNNNVSYVIEIIKREIKSLTKNKNTRKTNKKYNYVIFVNSQPNFPIYPARLRKDTFTVHVLIKINKTKLIKIA